MSSDPTKMRGFADQTKGSYYSATSTDELNKAFADIIGQINRKSSYKNVSITDTLSDYAEFVNANFGSNDVTVTASKDGNSVDLNESDYTVTVSGKTEESRSWLSMTLVAVSLISVAKSAGVMSHDSSGLKSQV